MKSVAFLTLGCKVNSYETNGMEHLFSQAGYEIKEFAEKADVYVINTCTVTNMADRKSRQMIHKARKMNPEGVVVAVGCYVQAAREEVEQDSAIDLVIGNNQKGHIVELVEQLHAENSQEALVEEMVSFQNFEEMPIQEAGENTRAYIKIQDGCNQFCSYCIIPHVRGRIRSRKEDEILTEVESLVKKGYQEVVLTGIHLSSYGVDFTEHSDFVKAKGEPLFHIIKKVSELEDLKRIRLGSLEPRIITEEFVSKLATIKKVCPHFHLSLQSGCDETLLRMNRKYTTEEYLHACKLLRQYFDNPAITTDIIVGFPQETEEEFAQTKAFMEKIRFSDVHIFKYSQRKGTKAADMKDQVDEGIKTRRSNELIQLGKKLTQEYGQWFLEKEQLILIEEPFRLETNRLRNLDEQLGENQSTGLSHDQRKHWVGHNERYVKLVVEAEGDIHNQMLTCIPREVLADGVLLCQLIKS